MLRDQVARRIDLQIQRTKYVAEYELADAAISTVRAHIDALPVVMHEGVLCIPVADLFELLGDPS
jgi:hypothetical protein